MNTAAEPGEPDTLLFADRRKSFSAERYLVATCLGSQGRCCSGEGRGMPLIGEAWAIAFGLNARGVTGIILAGLG